MKDGKDPVGTYTSISVEHLSRQLELGKSYSFEDLDNKLLSNCQVWLGIEWTQIPPNGEAGIPRRDRLLSLEWNHSGSTSIAVVSTDITEWKVHDELEVFDLAGGVNGS